MVASLASRTVSTVSLVILSGVTVIVALATCPEMAASMVVSPALLARATPSGEMEATTGSELVHLATSASDMELPSSNLPTSSKGSDAPMGRVASGGDKVSATSSPGSVGPLSGAPPSIGCTAVSNGGVTPVS